MWAPKQQEHARGAVSDLWKEAMQHSPPVPPKAPGPGGGPGEGGCEQAAKAAAVRATLMTELPTPVKLRAGADGTAAEEELARPRAGNPPLS